MIGVGMRQQDVLERGIGPELLAQMRDDLVPSGLVAPIDEHKPIAGRIAVAQDDSVPGLLTIPDRQKFDFAKH